MNQVMIVPLFAAITVFLQFGPSLSAGIVPHSQALICNIESYGAACDGTDDAPHIQRALNDPQCATVLVPAPRLCVSRALNISLMSGRSLLIEMGATLSLWPDPATYSKTAHNNMFISATDGDGSWTGPLLSNFTLSGGGTIVGHGDKWWPNSKTNRPRILYIPLGEDILVSNLTFIDSPAWNMGLRGHRMRIENMRLIAGNSSCGGFGHAPK